MRRWRRVDPWGLRQAVVGLFVLCGVAAASVVTASILREVAGGTDPTSALQMFGAVAFLAVWLTFAVRLYLAGVYRNERGLLLRYVHRSRLLPWSQVTGFDVRAARFLGSATVRNAAWVLTRDGAWETPVQQRSRLVGSRKNTGPVLSAADFDLMMARLREAHAAAQAGGGVMVR
ncbi:PH domain-containing protein [Micromonospora sp. NPDC047740]|uniref:PH domain-containing protein n=1 Tax=Micromonospora sp. NPDC047740 TaxID=3364254 RepID=UPI00371E00F7